MLRLFRYYSRHADIVAYAIDDIIAADASFIISIDALMPISSFYCLFSPFRFADDIFTPSFSSSPCLCR